MISTSAHNPILPNWMGAFQKLRYLFVLVPLACCTWGGLNAQTQTINIAAVAFANGFTDATSAIQTAINDSEVGAVINFGGATQIYSVSNTIYFPGGRTYSGAATIKLSTAPTPGYPLIELPYGNANNTTISGLTFNAGGFTAVMHIATATQPGVAGGAQTAPSGISITGCTFENSTPGNSVAPNVGAGIYNTVGIVNSTISGNLFSNVALGMSVVNPSNLTVSGNDFETMTSGDAMYFQIWQALSGLTITSNTGHNFYRMAVEIQEMQATNNGQPVTMDKVVIQGNDFENWVPSGAYGFGFSLVFTSPTSCVVSGNKLLNGAIGYGIEDGSPGCTVNSNTISGFAEGIAITAPNDIVTNNAISMSSDSGIQVTNANQEINSQISGNTITNTQVSGIFFVQGDSHGSVVENNTIKRAGGAWPNDGALTFDGIVIAGGLSAPITVNGNTITQTAASPPAGFGFWGIAVYGNEAGNSYQTNTISSTSTQPFGVGISMASSSILDGDVVSANVYTNLATNVAGGSASPVTTPPTPPTTPPVTPPTGPPGTIAISVPADGVTDATAALQAAINASIPGDTIAFGDATHVYSVSNTIYFPGGRTYSGAATIKLSSPPSPGFPLIELPLGNANNTTITGLTFNAGGFTAVMHIATASQPGVAGGANTAPSGISITGCKFNNATPGNNVGANVGAGIYNTVGIVNSTFSGNLFSNVALGMSIVNPSSLTVTGNDFETITSGDAMYFQIWQALSGLTITNNTGHNFYRMAVEIQEMQATNNGQPVTMDNVVIQGNDFENWVVGGAYGFGFSLVFTSPTSCNVSNNKLLNGLTAYGIEDGSPGCTVTSNTISGFNEGIAITAPNDIVTNNQLTGQLDSGIQITNANPEVNSQVQGNTITNPTNAGIMMVQGDHHGSQIQGNSISRQGGLYSNDATNVFSGIVIAGGLTAPITVSNNTITQTAASPVAGFGFWGIAVYGDFAGTVYNGNSVTSSSAAALGNGFNLNNGPLLAGDIVENTTLTNLQRVSNGFTSSGISTLNNIACKVTVNDPNLITSQACAGSNALAAVITTPTENQTVSGNVTVSATASGGSGGIAGVQFTVDGTNIGKMVTASPYSMTQNSTALSNGTHILTAVAHDMSGNTASSTGITVIVDNPVVTTPLTAAITFPTQSQTVSGTITVSATASGTGISGVQFAVDGANIGAVVAASPYSVTLNTTTLSNGTHTLTAIAQGTSGSTASSTAITVNVSNPAATTPLTTAITFPTQGQTVSGTITATATASGGAGSVGVQFEVDGNNIGAVVQLAPYSVTLNTTTLSNGAHILNALAQDTSGNAVSSPITVNVSNPVVVTPPVGTGPTTCPAAATNAFTGCYYLTTSNFFADLLWVETDPSIDFNFTGTSPNAAVPTGMYSTSTHWAGNFTFAAGTYVFTLTTSDGSRLWIDPTTPITLLPPNPIIDHWYDQNVNTYTAQVTLTAGTHLVRMDYFKDVAGPSVAQLSWTQVSGGSAPPSSVDPTITSPTQNQTVTGTITVTATASGGTGIAGVQFAVDGNNIGTPVTAPPYSVTLNTTKLSNGAHILTAIAQDTSGSTDSSTPVTVNVSNPVVTPPAGTAPTTCPAAGTNAFTGCYYLTTSTFFADLLWVETDPSIDFNFTGTSPNTAVPTGMYSTSTHWAGNFTFAAGTYVFTLTTNDGSRLWIDPTTPITLLPPNPIIDHWYDQNTNTYTAQVTLTAGTHLVRMDYFKDVMGSAVAQLSWTQVF
jgi:hypothetical protein